MRGDHPGSFNLQSWLRLQKVGFDLCFGKPQNCCRTMSLHGDRSFSGLFLEKCLETRECGQCASSKRQGFLSESAGCPGDGWICIYLQCVYVQHSSAASICLDTAWSLEEDCVHLYPSYAVQLTRQFFPLSCIRKEKKVSCETAFLAFQGHLRRELK